MNQKQTVHALTYTFLSFWLWHMAYPKKFPLKKKMPVTYPSRVTLKGVRIDLLILNSLELLFPAPAVYIIVSVPTLPWALSLPSNKWACNHSIAAESCLDKPPPTLPATYCGCQLTLTQMRSTDPDVRNFLSHENRGIEKWFSKLKGKKASELGDRYQNWVCLAGHHWSPGWVHEEIEIAQRMGLPWWLRW